MVFIQIPLSYNHAYFISFSTICFILFIFICHCVFPSKSDLLEGRYLVYFIHLCIPRNSDNALPPSRSSVIILNE